MNPFFRTTPIAGAALALAVMGLGRPTMARAQETVTVTTTLSGINVQGTGEVKVTPDIARLTLGVQTQDPDSQKASQENARLSDALIKAVRALGIAEKDVRTSGFSISPQYDYRPQESGKPPRIIGYQVSNTVTVTVRKLADTGRVIDAAVKAGANIAGGIEFDLNDEAKIKASDEALTRAVADALRKAQVIARAAKAGHIELVSIVEGGSGEYHPPVRPMAMMKSALAADTGTPVAPGEQTISASVSVRYSINPNAPANY